MLVSDLEVLYSGTEVNARLSCLPDDPAIPTMPQEFLLQGGAVARNSVNYQDTMSMLWKMMHKEKDEEDVCPSENWNEISRILTIELDMIASSHLNMIPKPRTIVLDTLLKAIAADEKKTSEDRPTPSPKPAARPADDTKRVPQTRLSEKPAKVVVEKPSCSKSVTCCPHKENDEESDCDTDDEDRSDEEDDNSDSSKRKCHCECDCFYCSLFDSEHIHDKSKAEEARERLSQKFKDKEESKKEPHKKGDTQVPNKINVKSVDNIVAFVESGDKAAAKKKRRKSKQQSKDVAYEEKVEQISDLNEKLSEINGKVKQQENKINQLHQSGGRNKAQKISLAQNSLKEIKTVKMQLEKDAHKLFGAMKELKPGVDLIEECAGKLAVMKILVPPPKPVVVPTSDKGSTESEESDEEESDENDSVEDESVDDDSAEDEAAEDESADESEEVEEVEEVKEQPVKVSAPMNGHKQKAAPIAKPTVSPKTKYYAKPSYQAPVNKSWDATKNGPKLNYMDMQLASNSNNLNNFSHSPTKGVYNSPVRQPSPHNNFADVQHTKTFFSNNAPKPSNQFNNPNRFAQAKPAFNSYRHDRPQQFDQFIRNYQFGPPPNLSMPPPLMTIPPPPIFTKFPPPPIFNSQPMKPSAQDVENFFTFTQSQFQPSTAGQNVPRSQNNFQADALNQSYMPFKATVKPLEPSAAFNGQRMLFNPELSLGNSSSLNDNFKSSFATKPEPALRMGFHEIPVPSPSAPYNFYQYLESLDEGKSSTNNQ